MSDVTRILSQIEQGDPQAAEALLPLVYEELRKLAAVKLAMEQPGQTLQATALVHEAYLRLVGGGKEARTEEPKNQQTGARNQEPVASSDNMAPGPRPLTSGRWNSRGHFLAAAAEAMRRILVERARQKRSLKGGGRQRRVDLGDVAMEADNPRLDLLALDEALGELEASQPRKAALIKLRFFAGLTNEEAAAALGISPTTADNDWAYAKTWLRLKMAGE
jgi:RNA polymerase sigma factor (sigma-70 family)